MKKQQAGEKKAKKANPKAPEPTKKAKAKVAETAVPDKAPAAPLSNKKVAKAPAVALKNHELAMKESAKKSLENADKKIALSARKAIESIEKSNLPVPTKKRPAPTAPENAKKPEAPAAKKLPPVKPTKAATPPAPKPKKEVVTAEGEAAPETIATKAAAAAAPAKPKRKPKRSKNVLRGKRMAKKKIWQRFVIDCTCLAEDMLMDVNDFEKYFKTHIKVKNKTNQLNDLVTFERTKNYSLIIHCGVHFSKRYFKYLAKRYLKKNSLRDWVRLVSTSKDTFTMRYFKIQGQDDDDDDDDDADAKI
ncbi:60S ribosomal protein L22 [Drosophila eugracilis]|uniref:60S ribosomal protein L22 n=1 Tax=Drosophila eugracilis TaxID=29029 RepID=UPI001BD9B1AE|nr:60S ribosomal protein L22 [Drosophila eugracilis]